MKYVNEFRDPEAAQWLLLAIAETVNEIGSTKDNPIYIMEICGGHTHTIFRYGLDRLISSGVKFIHGPGCPVCILPKAIIDECIKLVQKPGVIFTTFGDAMRIPGTHKSLIQAKAEGADVRMVYSPLDALAIARSHPDQEVVFFGLGFETTMPSTALSIQIAAHEALKNFSVFCNHITLPSMIKLLLDDPYTKLDGFIGPGHVSMVIGTHPYDFISNDYRIPIVVAGFEPLDLLQSVLMVLKQVRDRRAEVENQYARVVSEHGNPLSIDAINNVYEPSSIIQFLDFKEINANRLRIRNNYSNFDTERKFSINRCIKTVNLIEPKGCACGQVITGQTKPIECPQYGKGCTPEIPLGPLMVSSEGVCAAYWQYSGIRTTEISI
ncbi:MAG: hydrogenase formation protein HypD [Hyphomicrobiaceae bacterium]|nr:hydrogenase formation protein HypD [Hyphomicrobiaceae bacterium]